MSNTHGDKVEESLADIVEESSSQMFGVIRDLVRRACFWGLIYSIGVHKCNPIWILIPLSVSALNKYKAIRKSIENSKRITSDFKSLPAWVNYPDTERAEWLNKILRQLWPALQNYLTDTLNKVADDQKSSRWLSWFEFNKVSLGSIPPRIGGVKVFRQNQALRKEILMDMELTIATDCDISAKFFPFIGASIRDLYLHGILRIRLSPLLEDIPFVGNVGVAFITPPQLDFDLGGVANIVDIPGISRIVRNVIIEQISNMALVPNYYEVQLSEIIDIDNKGTLHIYEEALLVRIFIEEAQSLIAGDIKLVGKNTSDPYIVVRCKDVERKSQILKKTLDPEWNFRCEFVIAQTDLLSSEIIFEVWDYNKRTRHDFLGNLKLNFDEIEKIKDRMCWKSLENVDRGKIAFEINTLNLVTKDQLITDVSHLNQDLNISSAVVLIYLDSCRNLPRSKKGKAPSPCVTFATSSRDTKTSSVIPYSQNPVFEEEIRLCVANPHCDDLSLRVQDVKSGELLGLLRICLSDLLSRKKAMFKCQPWRLDQAPETSQIVMGIKIVFPQN